MTKPTGLCKQGSHGQSYVHVWMFAVQIVEMLVIQLYWYLCSNMNLKCSMEDNVNMRNVGTRTVIQKLNKCNGKIK